jgi:hypothetical protein
MALGFGIVEDLGEFHRMTRIDADHANTEIGRRERTGRGDEERKKAECVHEEIKR